MQEIIINQYPQVIRQIREIQQIARAEDIEFSKLRASAKQVIDNMFVLTANETGLERFEKLLDIKPNKESLNMRILNILARINQGKTTLSDIERMLYDYVDDIEIVNDFINFTMFLKFDLNISNMKNAIQLLDDFLPLNIYFDYLLEKEVHYYFGVATKFENIITIRQVE